VTPLDRRILPLASGLAAAAIAFAAVAAVTDDGDGKTVSPAASPAAVASGRELFALMGCGSCHTLSAADAHGQIAPDLDTRLASHTRASLTAKIRAPGETSMMPSNFGERMSDAELDALVDFLLAARPPG
jgi:mono/diheme cytochrome c family protein